MGDRFETRRSKHPYLHVLLVAAAATGFIAPDVIGAHGYACDRPEGRRGVEWSYLVAAGLGLPPPNGRSLAFAFAGGMAQIAGTVALIRSFSYRNFAVGTAYAKTEAVQTVPFSLILIGEGVSWGAAGGIGISLAGVPWSTTS